MDEIKSNRLARIREWYKKNTRLGSWRDFKFGKRAKESQHTLRRLLAHMVVEDINSGLWPGVH